MSLRQGSSDRLRELRRRAAELVAADERRVSRRSALRGFALAAVAATPLGAAAARLTPGPRCGAPQYGAPNYVPSGQAPTPPVSQYPDPTTQTESKPLAPQDTAPQPGQRSPRTSPSYHHVVRSRSEPLPPQTTAKPDAQPGTTPPTAN